MSTRNDVLTSLETQLNALSAQYVKKAVRRLLTVEQALSNAPYVGIIAGPEEKLLERDDGIRYGMRVILEIATKRARIEDTIDAIKDLIASPIDLGSNALACTLINVEDTRIMQDENFEYTRINLDVMYVELDSTYVVAFSNGIAGRAQYLTYAYLSSGSLVTNMYDTASRAKIKTSALTVDVMSVDNIQADAGTRGSDLFNNYEIQLSVKLHTSYPAQGMDSKNNIQIMDTVINRLQNHRSLSTVYRIFNVATAPYNITFDESLTTGAECVVTVRMSQYHTQV